MHLRLKLGAVLLALAFLVLPAAAATAATTSHQHHTPWGTIASVVIALGAGIAGTVTVTYSSFAADDPYCAVQTSITPYTGGTTPPTAAQATRVNRVNAVIAFTDSDTSIRFTHNWGLSAAQAAALEPDLIIYTSALGSASTTIAGITWSVSNTNAVVGTKGSDAGSGRTIVLTARRPATPGN